MKTTVFFSPVFLTFVDADGESYKTDITINAFAICDLIEKWNDRFSAFLQNNFPEIKSAKLDFDRYGDGITQRDRWFLSAIVETDDVFSDTAAALKTLYNSEIAEEFSKVAIKTIDQTMYVSLWDSEKSYVLTKEEIEEKFDFRYKLYCRDCKYLQKTADTDESGYGLCTYRPSYEPTTLDTRCRFLPETAELRCGDCARLGNDFACFTCAAEDSAMPDGTMCGGFIDKHEETLLDILAFWKLHNVYSRERVYKLLDKFEKEFESPLD